MRKAGERGHEATWRKVGDILDLVSPTECSNYLRNSGYVSISMKHALTEILPEDLRGLCTKVKDRGAPATAVHVRDIVKLVFAFAILHGEKVANPADEVGPASIATFVPKDRSLSPAEIRIMLGAVAPKFYPALSSFLRLDLPCRAC